MGLVGPLPMLLLAVATICSTPRHASVSADRSRRSTGAISAAGANAASASRLRARARTVAPAARSFRAMTPPSWPVAPTTSTRDSFMAAS